MWQQIQILGKGGDEGYGGVGKKQELLMNSLREERRKGDWKIGIFSRLRIFNQKKQKNMNSNQPEHPSFQSCSSDDLQDLREQVSITSTELIDLVSQTDRFIFKIKQLNESGINLLISEEFKEALIYLQQAQKILEYAASCGKTIDRSLIIATLQNQACIYQKLWDLEKSSNYMEAIIFNMNAYLQTPPPMIMNSQLTNISSFSYINLSNIISKRLQISFYYLQFSALSSQMNKHEVALGSALNALTTLKQICEECYNYEKHIRKEHDDGQYGSKQILKDLSSVKESVQIQKHDKYISSARKALKKMKTQIIKSEKEDEKMYGELVQFVIGEVMQVSIASMDSLNVEPSLKREISFIQKIYKVIYISIAFFTIATELRLISVQNYPESSKKESKEYRKSELYHLNAIILAAKYIPCETKYLTHILKSFTAHYNIDLATNFQQYQETTNETQTDAGGFLLTPSKKGIRFLDSPPISPLKLGKYSSVDNEETKIKIPLLHLEKRKKKKVGKSKEKIDHSSHKTIIKGRNESEKKKSLTKITSDRDKIKTLKNIQSPFDVGKEDKSMSKNKKQLKSNHKSKSQTQRDKSRQFVKDKINKKAKRLKEEYFHKPEQKKKGKHKVNTSNSLSKKMTENALLASPRSTFHGKNSVKNCK